VSIFFEEVYGGRSSKKIVEEDRRERSLRRIVEKEGSSRK
jgi:hypothetical protein